MREYMNMTMMEVEGIYEDGCGSMNLYLNEDAEAKFLVPDWGYLVGSGIGLSYRRHTAYLAWRASATSQCQSQLYPPSQGLRIWLQSMREHESSDVLGCLF